MPRLITSPTRIEAAGSPPKTIEEFIAVCIPAFSPETVRREG